jgi:hypothetical protein
MPNVLTDLAADIYKAADVVGRELVGAIPAATVNTSVEQVAVGTTVRSHFTRTPVVNNVAPSMTIPEGDDQTIDNKSMTLTKQRGVQLPWTGEEIRYVNGGSGFETIYGDQVAQAMRALVNEMEVDLCQEIYRNASRGVGTAGTTPFASNFNDVAEVRQILVDNGMPIDGQASIVMNSLAGTKLRNLATLQKANEAGGDTMLRQGVLLDLQGLMLRESAGIRTHTKGTGASYVVNAASGLPVGTTAITVDGGSGTIVAGDIVTFGSDTTQYVVATAHAGGTFTIAAPGLRAAVADNATVTVANNRTANFAFHRRAAEIAMRAPAKPLGGDAAVDSLTVQDPVSGLVFQVDAYKGFQKAMFSISAVWGVKAWKPEFIASLAG